MTEVIWSDFPPMLPFCVKDDELTLAHLTVGLSRYGRRPRAESERFRDCSIPPVPASSFAISRSRVTLGRGPRRETLEARRACGRNVCRNVAARSRRITSRKTSAIVSSRSKSCLKCFCGRTSSSARSRVIAVTGEGRSSIRPSYPNAFPGPARESIHRTRQRADALRRRPSPGLRRDGTPSIAFDQRDLLGARRRRHDGDVRQPQEPSEVRLGNGGRPGRGLDDRRPFGDPPVAQSVQEQRAGKAVLEGSRRVDGFVLQVEVDPPLGGKRQGMQVRVGRGGWRQPRGDAQPRRPIPWNQGSPGGSRLPS
jgi:hypothetical protein